MWTARPVWAILLTVLATFVAAFSSAVALVVPASLPLWQRVVAGCATALVAVGLVVLWRRHLVRRPWSGVALSWSWRALGHSLLGIGVAAAAILAAQTACVAVDACAWVPLSSAGIPLSTILVSTFISAVLVQGFPEELLWRGNLTDLLGRRWGPGVVLLVTSVAFGMLHLVSNGSQDGVGEHVLYVIMATALGFACGAARLRTGSTWAAVGVHGGFHLAKGLVPAQPEHLAVLLAAWTVTLVVGGLALLLVRRPTRSRSHATADRP
ncbi:hypothetical protein APR04_001912 [Promicromonospora umidemergens]|uniref:CAAX prenyl protease 2/Lysostaphin resistance protein A-like domain-containing protein n=1 Tax=Promicromonospora umidemergens TaxID=629679 RepID=A0ABP8XG85_9MICO|nr:type II CAAX endopeptidase family protein [Promicromonospora umidemergens]MCP2283009.1 hypothetical protein [Promicromonospora umidemergens]